MNKIGELVVLVVLCCAWSAAIAEDTHRHGHHHGDGMHQHWMSPLEAQRAPNPITADGASIKRGAQLYAQHCAVCHGAGGRGDGPAAKGLSPQPVNLQIMASHHPDGDLAWKIAEGRGPMPSWKEVLTKDQIWDVVNFLKKGLASEKS